MKKRVCDYPRISLGTDVLARTHLAPQHIHIDIVINKVDTVSVNGQSPCRGAVFRDARSDQNAAFPQDPVRF